MHLVETGSYEPAILRIFYFKDEVFVVCCARKISGGYTAVAAEVPASLCREMNYSKEEEYENE